MVIVNTRQGRVNVRVEVTRLLRRRGNGGNVDVIVEGGGRSVGVGDWLVMRHHAGKAWLDYRDSECFRQLRTWSPTRVLISGVRASSRLLCEKRAACISLSPSECIYNKCRTLLPCLLLQDCCLDSRQVPDHAMFCLFTVYSWCCGS